MATVSTQIVKRTGELSPWNREKIASAIHKAFNHVGVPSDSGVEEVTTAVEGEVAERFLDFRPNVENIQDIVEKQLMLHHHFDVAKAYILYRRERSKARQNLKKSQHERIRTGRLTLIKRSGLRAVIDIGKMETFLIGLTESSEDRSLLLTVWMDNLYDGMSSSHMLEALLLGVTSIFERHPRFERLAAKVLLKQLQKQTLRVSTKQGEIPSLQSRHFVHSIASGIEREQFDARLAGFDLQKLTEAIDWSRDSLLGYMGLKTLSERYLLKHKEQIVELPQMFWMRVAMGLAMEENRREERAIEFYHLISTLRFVPSTPTLFHSGLSRPQLSSCYLTTVGDDLSEIFKSFGDNAQLSKWSGGLGNDWSNIRSIGSHIHSTQVESQGVIPFLKIANDVTVAINRSGKRRGATCAYLELWHSDIEDFLDLRRNTGDDRRRAHDMNTAVWVPDLFMQRLAADGEWTLFSPSDDPDLHETYGNAFKDRYEALETESRISQKPFGKTISAQELWRKLLTRLFETGHPWLTFKDPCNVRSPQSHVGVVHSSNLCTEITLNTSRDEIAVCNLGSVNLAKHVDNGQLHWEKLKETVRVAIRMLDNVIDVNFYPVEEAKNSNIRHRPIGLGIMGTQDLLWNCNMHWESPEATDLIDSLMEEISWTAIDTSSNLAVEKGQYSSFPGSKWDQGVFPLDSLDLLAEERRQKIPVHRKSRLNWDSLKQKIKKQGMRNSNLMAIAPTATIATIAGCYPSIEPQYGNLYVKSNISGEFTIVNPNLVQDLEEHGLWNESVLSDLKHAGGSIQGLTQIPEGLRHKYRGVFEINPRTLIRLTAVRSKWIDQSQSHNVFLSGKSGKELSEVYQYAWEMGLKTTYYLRSLGASQIEKSTLAAENYGKTQLRQNGDEPIPNQSKIESQENGSIPVCKLADPTCEACQ